jgi:glucan phosphoethanolaminetransferase (alkaline phosphatase superfamily)
MIPRMSPLRIAGLRASGAGWAGALGAITLLVAFSALGDTPDPHDSSAQTAVYFQDHRHDVAVGVAIFAVAFALLSVFFAALVVQLRLQPVAATCAGIAAVSTLLLFVLDQVMYETIAFRVASDTPASAKPLFLVTIASVPLLGMTTAVLFASVGYAWRRCALPGRWWSVVSLLAALAVVPSIVSFADAGFFYPDTQQQVVATVLVIWLIGTGVLLAGARRRPTSQEAL